jgi:hypothetical protein
MRLAIDEYFLSAIAARQNCRTKMKKAVKAARL